MNQLNRELLFRALPSFIVSCSSRPNSTRVKHFNKILIANRGEIAVRVIKTARRLGIRTVAVFSEADSKALHSNLADEAFCVGPAPSQQSYLRSDVILDIARRSGVDAIHPGYGFLSENAEFADLCSDSGIVFIGPPAGAIRDMGLKNRSKQIMESANVPVIEGYHDEDDSDNVLFEQAKRIGYPIMLKAVRGGGGKGMRIARNPDEFQSQLESARRESEKAFGDSKMIIERFVERPRHVEVQVFGDHQLNYVYLWERDCSVQRRHQKVIEEAPAPLISDDVRRRIGEAAVAAARSVGYYNAGTVEFVMDPEQRFFFMEMNTRLQVEHPVTEAITGLDLVEWQIRVAEGNALPIIDQNRIPMVGHAFEARIYAEDPKNNFLPGAGTLTHLEPPVASENVRIDSAVGEGDEVSVHYDPMIAKLIVKGETRRAAMLNLDRALAQYHISGLSTNIDFLRNILKEDDFRDGNVYTDFIADHEASLLPSDSLPSAIAQCQGVVGFLLSEQAQAQPTNDPYTVFDNYRINLSPQRSLSFVHGGNQFDVTAEFKEYVPVSSGCLQIVVGDSAEPYNVSYQVTDCVSSDDCKQTVVRFSCTVNGQLTQAKYVHASDTQQQYLFSDVAGQIDLELAEPDWVAKLAKLSGTGGAANLSAPMPGVVEKVNVAPGQEVQQGDTMIVMIAMKMEYVIKAPSDGIVDAVHCQAGLSVNKGFQLVSMKNEEDK